MPQRLDKLIGSGRLTAEEAERLQAASGSNQVEGVLTSIRVRHAAIRLDAAVGRGQLTRAEADRLLDRIRAGDHSHDLRAQIRRLEQADTEWLT